MVDNFHKVKQGITFVDGYGPSATEEGGLRYYSPTGRLELRDGYGNIKTIAFTTDELLPPTNANFAVPRIVLNVTSPTSNPVDSAGLVIKFGESAGDELFGSTLFSGVFNPCVLWDEETQSWFIGTASSEGLRVGTDAYGTTLTSNNQPRISISSNLYITPGYNLIIPENAASGYVLVADAAGVATWQPPGSAFAIPLQAAYNAGNTIATSTNIPVSISGTGVVLIVSGTAQTKGIKFTSQATTPFAAADVGLYTNASNDLLFDRPAPLSTINLTQAIGSVDALATKYWNNTGIPILKGTPVRINSFGELDVVNISDITHATKIVGVTAESIDTGDIGTVAISGKVYDIATSADFGDIVYIDKFGGLTNIMPEVGINSFTNGDFFVRVGMITRNTNNPTQKDLTVALHPPFRI